MKIKSDMSGMAITVNAAEFARVLALATHHEVLRKELAATQDKNRRMRAELTKYQAICELNASGAGASKEPQQNETIASENKTGAVLLTKETEGRVSGGERAGIPDGEKEVRQCS